MPDIPDEVKNDLYNSGLTDSSIDKMRIRPATLQDTPFAASGYVIPYFLPAEEGDGYTRLDVSGVPFVRVKLLTEAAKNGESPKYYQRAKTGSHIYFPPLVDPELWWDTDVPLIITEGEKKAAKATQEGFLCAAVGGIDSWRSKKIRVPAEAVEAGGAKDLVVDLDSVTELKVETKVADELLWLPLEGRLVYICFDSDEVRTKQQRVARAAFDMALWLEQQGADPRHVVIPVSPGEKIGLDDFLLAGGDFNKLMARAKFPIRPRIKSWIKRQLGTPRKSRNTLTGVSRAVLAALDQRGTRFKDPYGVYYYFDRSTDTLYSMPIEVEPNLSKSAPEFHQMLVREFGISSADREVGQRLVDDFESLPTIELVNKVHRQSYAAPDAFYYQLSDSRMAKTTKEGTVVLRNGTDGVLFEVGTRPVQLYDKGLPRDFGWLSTLRHTTLEPLAPMTQDETYVFAACLFYLSPWLRRWRGLMLPAELAISEAGSGKSSLYQLRQGIYAGNPTLGHQPDDIRSWYAAIAASRGMWVADNVGSKIDARLSNEIARLITDPEPAFETRELFTTSKVHRRPVDCTFAFTAIYNPFHRPDFLQRSIKFQFHALREKRGSWLLEHTTEGARAKWITHHLQVMQTFFQVAETLDWSIVSKHRLVGFEQSVRCMGITLGCRTEVERVLEKLPMVVQETITSEEPIIEALKAFAQYRKSLYERSQKENHLVFKLQDLCEWVQTATDGRFSDLRVFAKVRLTEKYIAAHRANVYDSTAITQTKQVLDGQPIFTIDTGSTAYRNFP